MQYKDAGRRGAAWLALAWLAACWPMPSLAVAEATAAQPAAAEAPRAQPAVAELPVAQPFELVREVVGWVTASQDAQGRPFAVVDKKQARLYVYTADGLLAGASSALIGATPGDHTVEGVGERAQRGQVREDERTTPAGRFESVPGRNLGGEHVVWADHASAFAIHRVRPGKWLQSRLDRLASPDPGDNRVSLGCVVVPVEFYTKVVQRVLGTGPGVVYVLPETGGWAEAFAAKPLQVAAPKAD